MPRRLIGVTAANVAAHENSTKRLACNLAYLEAVERAGGVPVVLPNTTDHDLLPRILGTLDGLLITGGADVSPAYYGQAPHPALGEVDTCRDAMEIPLIRAAIHEDVPILAICRGMQVLNVAMGGTLYQHLPEQRPSAINHVQPGARSAFSHTVEVAEDTLLGEIVGSGELHVNSLHHQAVHQTAEEFTVTALSPDGIVEGLERQQSRFLVAVQFHPEETSVHDERTRRLFTAFLEAT